MPSPVNQTETTHALSYRLKGVAKVAEVINFYEELGLDRSATVADIRVRLKRARLEYSAKAMRGSGSLLEEFKRMLELVDKADRVFKSEDSRDQYDLTLRRAVPPETTPIVNWVGRAWAYYFSGDNGAALVAARKAKEQSPDQPMAYVISAWVWLKEDEPQQAKRDADEAFVLDELGTDSVDVHEVRGAVYLTLRDYGRAAASFERGLARASDGEKPELYWRKSIAHLGLGQPRKAYEAARAGLSHTGEISAELRATLEDTTVTAIHTMDNCGQPDKSLESYAARRDKIAASEISNISKSRLLSNMEANIERCTRWKELQGERARLNGVKSPIGDLPSTPRGAIGASVTFFVFAILFTSFSLASSFVVFLCALAAAAVAIFKYTKRDTWKTDHENYKNAQQALQSIRRDIDKLMSPIGLS